MTSLRIFVLFATATFAVFGQAVTGRAQPCTGIASSDSPDCASNAQPQPDPIVIAVGDIACSTTDSTFNDGRGSEQACRQADTAALAATAQPAGVLLLGDLQYSVGALEQFQQSFDRSWGVFLPITHPVPGNHEYETRGARGYFEYFGPQAGSSDLGYYSMDIGAWHIVALNSNCSQVGGCRESSPQGQWLKNDLAASQNTCTLAFWHHPRFSSSEHGSGSDVAPFWRILHTAGADLVLDGHDHVYERFAPQRPDGEADPEFGIVQLTVGTGGRSLYTFNSPLPNSLVQLSRFGVLRLELHPTTADWHFMTVDGGELDSGNLPCHGIPPQPAS
jgi:hypothetical protein